MIVNGTLSWSRASCTCFALQEIQGGLEKGELRGKKYFFALKLATHLILYFSLHSLQMLRR